MANKRDPSGAVLKLAGRTPANKGRRLPAELLSSEEIRALIRACSSRAPTGVRNRALIAVLYRGGLRISEALPEPNGARPARRRREVGRRPPMAAGLSPPADGRVRRAW